MSDILNLIIGIIERCFEIMEDIEFLGTNLLKFNLTLLLIGITLPILITLVKTASNNTIEKSGNERGKK